MTIEAIDRGARGLRPRGAAPAAGVFGLLRRLDWILLGVTLSIVLYGLRAINGITRHDPGGSLVGRQALYAGVGAVLLVIAILIDPAIYRRFKMLIYVGALGV